MKLCAPLPGHLDGTKEILEARSGDLCEVYIAGSSDYVSTGRQGLGEAPHDHDLIERQTELCHRHGVRINVLMNASCVGGKHLTDEGINLYMRYFEDLASCGVDAVTLADPYLIEVASKNFSFDVVVSCISFVDSPEKAIFYEELGADAITPDTSINRDFRLLEAIVDAVSCEIRILVNEGCLYKCPFRPFDFNVVSHTSGPPPHPKISFSYYQRRCRSLRVKKPWLIMKANWVRPEDLGAYEEIGIDTFKISGRNQPVSWIIETIAAYKERNYHGNLLNILDYSRSMRSLFYIPNEELDGALERWKRCDKICHRCGFCRDLTARVMRVYVGKGTAWEEMRQIETPGETS